MPWHAPVWEAWRRRVQADRRGHALLLTGPRGVGKAALAERMVAGLVCLNAAAAGAACGACTGCRQHGAGSHPDVLVLRPDPDQPGPLAHYPVQAEQREAGRSARFITVGQVRALIDHLTRSAGPAGVRIGVLWPADALAEAGANALLKILEEPPASALLLLLAHRPAMLPATVRSRCQVLRVPLPAPAEARAWLQAVAPGDPARHTLALELAAGAPLLAREYAGEDPSGLWQTVAGGVESVLVGGDPVAVADAWQRLPAERVEQALYAWLRTALRARCAAAGGLQSAPEAVSWTVCTTLLDELETLRRSARIALSRPLAWEGLLVRVAEAA